MGFVILDSFWLAWSWSYNPSSKLQRSSCLSLPCAGMQGYATMPIFLEGLSIEPSLVSFFILMKLLFRAWLGESRENQTCPGVAYQEEARDDNKLTVTVTIRINFKDRIARFGE